MHNECTPQDAHASTAERVLGSGVLTRIREEEEALQRFREASRAYWLLCECKGAPPERLEEAGRLMDAWAARLRS